MPLTLQLIYVTLTTDFCITSLPVLPHLLHILFLYRITRSSLLQVFCKIGVLKHFAKYKKQMCRRLFSIEWGCEPATLLKRDSKAVISLEFWLNFSEYLFHSDTTCWLLLNLQSLVIIQQFVYHYSNDINIIC